ncbi:hypothetical protein [Haliangium ochraceum]|uniref:Uncharacterized protein n=1 Tax=Haliangium ochraceum (strain DSM 14365 / JCM 11303 / SMP-2) TaxID=502025 RepID=D0LZS1_HALO1|nr:hypothetical protein [Haliangium ochraceum]ACY18050.1 hypothetical protein Hoch_5568 [Haliangium ochraceum DSM 14365]
MLPPQAHTKPARGAPAWFLLALLGWAACGSAGGSAEVRFTPAEDIEYEPEARPTDQVELRFLGPAPAELIEVGRLLVREDDDDRLDPGKLVDALRTHAAEHGCELVLIEPPYDETLRVRFRFEYLQMTRPVYHGACLVTPVAEEPAPAPDEAGAASSDAASENPAPAAPEEPTP